MRSLEGLTSNGFKCSKKIPYGVVKLVLDVPKFVTLEKVTKPPL